MNWGTVLLIIGGGLIAALVIPNMQRCAGGVVPANAGNGWWCANGNLVPPGGTCPPATPAQMFNCYTSFSGGYQGSL
jgi:hypothetical protein